MSLSKPLDHLTTRRQTVTRMENRQALLEISEGIPVPEAIRYAGIFNDGADQLLDIASQSPNQWDWALYNASALLSQVALGLVRAAATAMEAEAAPARVAR